MLVEVTVRFHAAFQNSTDIPFLLHRARKVPQREL
jgi:hypothetical protein